MFSKVWSKVEFKKPTIQTTSFGDNTSSGSEASSPKLDELTHQQDIIGLENQSSQEEPESEQNHLFVEPKTTSNMLSKEVPGLVKLEPTQKK